MTPKVQLFAYTFLMALIIFSAYADWIPTKLHNIPFYDSFGHFVLYGFWGYFFGNAFSKPVVKANNFHLQTGILVTAIIAIAEEFIQLLFPVRSFSFFDLGFGLFGIVVGCIVLNIRSKRRLL